MLRARQWLAAACALAAAVLAAAPAGAHPHVWVGTVATFVFDGARLVAVRFDWTFDPFLSSMLKQDFDANRDGRFDAEETAKIREAVFDGLGDQDYYSVIAIDGAKTPTPAPTGFEATLRKDMVTFRFTMALPEPVDPSAVDVTVANFDPSFYVDLTPVEVDPIRFEGIGKGACRFRLFEDTANPIYYGAVFPQVARLACGPA